MGRRRSRPRLSWRSKRGKQSVAPLNHKPTTERSTTGAGIMSQEDSAFAPPQIAHCVLGVKSGRREGLKAVAIAQKAVLGCIALSFLYVCAAFLLSAALSRRIGRCSMIRSSEILVPPILCMRVSNRDVPRRRSALHSRDRRNGRPDTRGGNGIAPDG